MFLSYSEQFYRAVKCKLFSYQHTEWIWHTHNRDSLQHWFERFGGLPGENRLALRAGPMLEWSLQDPTHESHSCHEEPAYSAKVTSSLAARMNLNNSFKSTCNLMHQVPSLPFPVSLSAYPFRPSILVINLSKWCRGEDSAARSSCCQAWWPESSSQGAQDGR